MNLQVLVFCQNATLNNSVRPFIHNHHEIIEDFGAEGQFVRHFEPTIEKPNSFTISQPLPPQFAGVAPTVESDDDGLFYRHQGGAQNHYAWKK